MKPSSDPVGVGETLRAEAVARPKLTELYAAWAQGNRREPSRDSGLQARYASSGSAPCCW